MGTTLVPPEPCVPLPNANSRDRLVISEIHLDAAIVQSSCFVSDHELVFVHQIRLPLDDALAVIAFRSGDTFVGSCRALAQDGQSVQEYVKGQTRIGLGILKMNEG